VPPVTVAPSIATSSSTNSYTYGAVKLYVPLQFWFCKNPGLYLPLLAMQYCTLRLNLKLRPLAQLVWQAGAPQNTDICPPPSAQVRTAKIKDIKLYGDYVHLDVEERRRFVANSHEYLIEQIQYTPKVDIPGSSTTAVVPLEFNHCVRELLWVLQRNAVESNNEWFNFSSTSTQEPGLRRDMLEQAVVQMDGYDRFETRDAGYFRLVQPFQRHTNVPTESFIYLYAFAIKPEEQQPSGSFNASRIDTLKLQVYLRPDSGLATTDANYVPVRGNSHIRVYALNHNVLRVVEGFAGVLFRI